MIFNFNYYYSHVNLRPHGGSLDPRVSHLSKIFVNVPLKLSHELSLVDNLGVHELIGNQVSYQIVGKELDCF